MDSAERRFKKGASILLVDPVSRYHVVARCLGSTYHAHQSRAPLVTKVRVAGVIIGYMLHWYGREEFTLVLNLVHEDGQCLLISH
jgi:hypothetical protein